MTASSAFPPVLSPAVLKTDPDSFTPADGADLCRNPDYCRKIYLTDGGVYDNLGLETVWNRYDTVLVSDAGAPMKVDDDVKTSWHGQAMRAMDIAINQSRALRKRALLGDFRQGVRKGTYWGIKTDIRDYGLPDALVCEPRKVLELAGIRTRLNSFSDEEQCMLINWGYALCDAGIRKYVLPGLPGPAPRWPCPSHPL